MLAIEKFSSKIWPMDAEKMHKAFSFKYPDKRILQQPSEDNPTAVICEIEPASEHPEYSVARVALGSFEPHYHKLSSQTYNVLRGKLLLTLTMKEVVLIPGTEYIVPPNMVHSGESVTEDTVVEVTSRPGWTSGDHIFVNQPPSDSPLSPTD